MTKNTKLDALLEAIQNEFNFVPAVISRTDLKQVCENQNFTWPAWLTNDPQYRADRGVYRIPNVASVAMVPNTVVKEVTSEPAKATMSNNVVPLHPETQSGDYIPSKVSGYVPFGHFNDLRAIVRSRKFYPAFITGHSGNGKTMMVEQICATEKREYIRVNVTIETDEDDLIGGFRLVDGQTVWQNGPVVVAMQRGAVLLLDEVDLGSNKLMCLQPVLEGKSIFLKKINKKIDPTNGFTVIATGNTKGKGSDDGRFIGTNVMNEAFLERFPITFEQEFPASKVEQKILNNVLGAAGIEDTDFTEKLVTWADAIRKTFAEGAVTEIISTRRLVHICEAFAIFNSNRIKALELCLSRFDTETKVSFMSLYKKLDAVDNPKTEDVVLNTNVPLEDQEIPF